MRYFKKKIGKTGKDLKSRYYFLSFQTSFTSGAPYSFSGFILLENQQTNKY